MSGLCGRTVGGVRMRGLLGLAPAGPLYLGHDLFLDRPVAARVLAARFEAEPESMHRLDLEFRRTCSVDHPNLARNLRLSTAGSPFLLVREYVEGTDLGTRLAAGPLSLGEVLDLAVPLARALGHLHDLGLVHRDVKPSNVLVEPGGRVRLVDLELAEPLAIRPGLPARTTGYLAPELVFGDGDATPWSDAFALGALLHELLTGRVPYAGRTPLDVFRRMRDGIPCLLRLERPGIPPALEELVARLLSAEPSERPWRGEEIARRLEACRETETSPRGGGRDPLPS